MFTVPKKDGTRRPIIDLRQLNQFIEKVPFKMEDLTQIPSVPQKGGGGGVLCKIDLQDALPFGLASSPRIFFTKCLKPLLVFLRSLRVRLLVYLDNFLIMAHTKEQCLERAQLIVGL